MAIYESDQRTRVATGALKCLKHIVLRFNPLLPPMLQKQWRSSDCSSTKLKKTTHSIDCSAGFQTALCRTSRMCTPSWGACLEQYHSRFDNFFLFLFSYDAP